MILGIGDPEDVHFGVVAKHLGRIGADLRILDPSDLGERARISLTHGSHGSIVFPNGGRIDSEQVQTVWYRRPERWRSRHAYMDPRDQRFVEDEWRGVLRSFLLGLDALFVNPIAAQERAEKPLQLDAARKVGLRVPDTLVTSDPLEARAFVQKHEGRVIHKSASRTQWLRFPDVRRWDEADAELLGRLSIAPATFQAQVEGPADLRVTVVGPRVFAARIETALGCGGIDSRFDLDAPITPTEIDGDLEERILALMKELGLVHGALDLKLDGDGTPWFLEVNVQGQYLAMEILTDLPISEALAGLLAAGRPAQRG